MNRKLSGLSPFMGDNDAETFANITRADFDFDDEAFAAVSEDARDFIKSLLVKRKENRLTAEQCLKHRWMTQHENLNHVVLSTDKLKKFIIRRKWQKTGNAIRAVGRMATLSASRRNSSTGASTSGSPRPSVSGANMSRMSSLNEEDSLSSKSGFTEDELTPPKSSPNEEEIASPKSNSSDLDSSDANASSAAVANEIEQQTDTEIQHQFNTKSSAPSNKSDCINRTMSSDSNDSKNQFGRMRMCSERSDSGISDCSVLPTQQSSAPLLAKKLLISDATENGKTIEGRSSILGSEHKHGKLVESKNSFNIGEQKILKLKEKFTGIDLTEGRIPSAVGKLEKCDLSSTKAGSVKKNPPKSDLVASTIKKFDALSATSSKAKSSTNSKLNTTPLKTTPSKESIPVKTLISSLSKELVPVKEPSKLNSNPAFKTFTPPMQRKSRLAETTTDSSIKRYFSSSPHRLIKTPPTSASFSAMKQRTSSPISQKKKLSSSLSEDANSTKLQFTSKSAKQDATASPVLKSRLLTQTNNEKNAAASSEQHKNSKKNAVEKHLDTSSPFQKAAAFWKQS